MNMKLHLLTLALTAAHAAASFVAPGALAQPASPQAAMDSINTAASNATLTALATLLAGKGYANNSCPLIKDARIAAEAAIVSDKLAAVASSESPKLCATLEGLTPAGLCAVGGFLERALTSCTSFPGSCNAVSACANATGTGAQVPPPTTSITGAPLPQPLADARPLKPWPFPPSTLTEEGATYYWVYRNVLNLYAYYPCAGNGTAAFLAPAGYTLVAIANLAQVDPDGAVLARPLPFAAVLFNPTTQTLAVIVRGTSTKAEWLTDFDYTMVKPDASLNIPGLVHKGFLGAYMQIAPAINAALDTYVLSPPAGGPVATSVLFGAHSLGSGVAQIAALAAAARLGNAASPAAVSAVLHAPPNTGDAVFAAAFDVAVNGRRVAFVYDPVPQVPCKGFYGCSAKHVPVATGPADGVPPWPYASIGGTVKLTPAAMGPQAAYWGGLDRINLCYMLQQLGAAHVCSYACATAPFAAGVVDTQCLLRPAAAGELATNSYCNSPPMQGKPDGWPQAAFPPAGKVW